MENALHRRTGLMALDAKYLYVVMMDVEPDKEELFNKTYDEEHIPILTKVLESLALHATRPRMRSTAI